MKKRMLMLAAACMTVVALVGCGAPKAPTLEELKDNISDKTPSSYEMTGSVEAKASMKVVDPSEDTQMVLDMVEDQYGIDLTEKVDVAVSVDVESNGQRNEECSYVTSKGTINFKSKNSVIQDLIDEQLEEEDLDNLNRENYTDYEEEIRYTKGDDGDWYYEDYEPDDKDDDKTVDAFGSFIDYCVAHNENDEEDQITIEVDGDEFVLKYAIEINNEFAESVDKNEKKALQNLLDNLEIEVDLEDLFDMYEEYGEYAEVAIPFDMELRFSDMGTKKDRDFVFTGVKVTLGGSVNCDWDEEMVADIFEQAGMPLDSLGKDVSFGLELGAEATLSIDATIKYDEEIELEIPSKVTKNAVEKDEYFGSAAVVVDDEDDWTVEEDDDDDVVATTDDDVKKANADGSYTLCDYNGDEVAKLNVPDGWTVSEYASDSYIPMNNDETYDSLYITCSVPSGIIAFYDEDASDYDKEKMEEYEYLDTIGDYDFYYRAEFDEVHAIKFMEENSSVCIYAYVDDNEDYYVINSVEDFEELIEDNF